MRWLAGALLSLAALTVAWAQSDPPGRVGRFVDFQGATSLYDHQLGQWVLATRNLPLTSGDRVSTDSYARADLRIGSTTLRLGAGSELEVLQLDDERLVFQLHSGSLALRVRSRDVAGEIEVVTQEARMRPMRSGHYRVDRFDDRTFVGSWRGDIRVDDGTEVFTVESGRRAEVWRDGDRRTARHEWSALPTDEFADWVAREDRRDSATPADPYVSPEMTGAEDLDRDGRWEQSPDYGAIWVPLAVAPDWAPYRYGHWTWVAPWGWTWVDDAPWGFAPFHYGRWLRWHGRWCWAPGAYVPRPVYAPALVAWVGGPHLNVSVSIGGPPRPAVGWVPLAPREVFVPYYAATPVYIDRVNHRRPGRPRPPQPVPTGPIMYSNQGVPGAVTVVPQDVLARREPVARAVVEVTQPLQRIAPPPAAAGPAPGARLAPPPARAPVQRPVTPPPTTAVPAWRSPVPQPSHVTPVPGGAEPAPSHQRERPPPAQPRPPERSPVAPVPRAAPVPAPQVAPVPAPQVVPVPAPQVVPVPAPRVVPVPAPRVVPVPPPRVVPVPASPAVPAAAPAAAPAVPAQPAERDDPRMHTPESRGNMRDREQQR